MRQTTLQSLGLPAREITLNELGKMAMDDHLDRKQAETFAAALDFAKELQAEIDSFVPDKSPIVCSDDAVSRVYGKLRNRPAGESWALCVDENLSPIALETLLKGQNIPGISGLIVFRMVDEITVDEDICSLVYSFKSSLNYRGIGLNDYILLKQGEFFSFADEKATKLNF